MTGVSGVRLSRCRSLEEGLSVLLGVVVLAALAACDGDATSQSSPAVASATEQTPDACQLLTPDEIALATGWTKPTAHDADTGAAYVTSCNFTAGENSAVAVTVTVSTGGPTHKSAAEYAQSVGDNGGMLTEPATAVDGFPIPVIATSIVGGLHGMQARTPAAVELTVMTGSPETTRALFPKALTRLLAAKSQ